MLIHRQVSCSRDRPNCRRCVSEGTHCVYSRSGVIRRKRKTKEPLETQSSKDGKVQRMASPDKDESGYAVPPSELAVEIEATRERLYVLT